MLLRPWNTLTRQTPAIGSTLASRPSCHAEILFSSLRRSLLRGRKREAERGTSNWHSLRASRWHCIHIGFLDVRMWPFRAPLAQRIRLLACGARGMVVRFQNPTKAPLTGLQCPRGTFMPPLLSFRSGREPPDLNPSHTPPASTCAPRRPGRAAPPSPHRCPCRPRASRR